MIHEYEKCAHCWHFIEPNDGDDYPYPFPVAEYIHLDDGEKEHDHDAAPSGDKRTLDQWRIDFPQLFMAGEDGKIGPNSSSFSEEC